MRAYRCWRQPRLRTVSAAEPGITGDSSSSSSKLSSLAPRQSGSPHLHSSWPQYEDPVTPLPATLLTTAAGVQPHMS